ncbi:MAG: hypothetical protein ACRD6X_01715 [Pyrinomonadaceae bacterium]
MLKHLISKFAAVAVALISTAAIYSQAVTINPHLEVGFADVRGGICSVTDGSVGMITEDTPSRTLLFNRTFRGQPAPQFCDPVLNPNGSQMTLGQFRRARGLSVVKCTDHGTLSAFFFSGLRPRGVYSVWIIIPNPNPGPPVGVGGIGRTALSENSFVADAFGNGHIIRTTPEQDLSLFGSVGPCLLDGPFMFDFVYHSDGQTYGPSPGPPNTVVTNGNFVFP